MDHIYIKTYLGYDGMVLIYAVLSKFQNPRSPNGPPMVDDWVVRITFGWSVYVVVRNDNKTLNINITSVLYIFNHHSAYILRSS